MSHDFQNARVAPPRQNRSEDSLERILDATRRLLDSHSFEELSIARIVREARSSVGVFYARFADKQALLDSLDELYTLDVVREFEALGQRWQDEQTSVTEMIDQAALFLVDFHRPRRGVVRALVLHARLHPKGPFTERTRRMISGTPTILSALLERASDMSHPDPETAVRFAFVQALATVREHVLFPEGHAAITRLDDPALAREVARAWRSYLGIA
jgi:AcrR family transcriptional regulator